MRVVLDTNVFVSRYLSPHGIPAQILRRWRAEAFEWVVSEPILAEYQEVLGYDRLRRAHGLSIEEIDSIVENVRKFATMVAPDQHVPLIEEDPDDDKFLEAALAGEAELLVSGDHHLLQLKSYRGIRVVTPSAFLAILDQEETGNE